MEVKRGRPNKAITVLINTTALSVSVKAKILVIILSERYTKRHFNSRNKLNELLTGAFRWGHTSEGHNYWARVYRLLKEKDI